MLTSNLYDRVAVVTARVMPAGDGARMRHLFALSLYNVMLIVLSLNNEFLIKPRMYRYVMLCYHCYHYDYYMYRYISLSLSIYMYVCAYMYIYIYIYSLLL